MQVYELLLCLVSPGLVFGQTCSPKKTLENFALDVNKTLAASNIVGLLATLDDWTEEDCKEECCIAVEDGCTIAEFDSRNNRCFLYKSNCTFSTDACFVKESDDSSLTFIGNVENKDASSKSIDRDSADAHTVEPVSSSETNNTELTSKLSNETNSKTHSSLSVSDSSIANETNSVSNRLIIHTSSKAVPFASNSSLNETAVSRSDVNSTENSANVTAKASTEGPSNASNEPTVESLTPSATNGTKKVPWPQVTASAATLNTSTTIGKHTVAQITNNQSSNETATGEHTVVPITNNQKSNETVTGEHTVVPITNNQSSNETATGEHTVVPITNNQSSNETVVGTGRPLNNSSKSEFSSGNKTTSITNTTRVHTTSGSTTAQPQNIGTNITLGTNTSSTPNLINITDNIPQNIETNISTETNTSTTQALVNITNKSQNIGTNITTETNYTTAKPSANITNGSQNMGANITNVTSRTTLNSNIVTVKPEHTTTEKRIEGSPITTTMNTTETNGFLQTTAVSASITGNSTTNSSILATANLTAAISTATENIPISTSTLEGNKSNTRTNPTGKQQHRFHYPHFESPESTAISGALIAAVSFGVIFFFSVLVLVGKRCFDSWQRRHYSRMDYLINGMYN